MTSSNYGLTYFTTIFSASRLVTNLFLIVFTCTCFLLTPLCLLSDVDMTFLGLRVSRCDSMSLSSGSIEVLAFKNSYSSSLRQLFVLMTSFGLMTFCFCSSLLSMTLLQKLHFHEVDFWASAIFRVISSILVNRALLTECKFAFSVLKDLSYLFRFSILSISALCSFKSNWMTLCLRLGATSWEAELLRFFFVMDKNDCLSRV